MTWSPPGSQPCPGVLGRGCGVFIPLGRELCHFCWRTLQLVRSPR